jgi:hypothetical protein
MNYLIENRQFTFSYQEIKGKIESFIELDDESFMRNLIPALHLACFVCYLKDIPSQHCLNDKGIIHELVHLLHIPDGNTTSLGEIRSLFKTQLQLS